MRSQQVQDFGRRRDVTLVELGRLAGVYVQYSDHLAPYHHRQGDLAPGARVTGDVAGELLHVKDRVVTTSVVPQAVKTATTSTFRMGS